MLELLERTPPPRTNRVTNEIVTSATSGAPPLTRAANTRRWRFANSADLTGCITRLACSVELRWPFDDWGRQD